MVEIPTSEHERASFMSGFGRGEAYEMRDRLRKLEGNVAELDKRASVHEQICSQRYRNVIYLLLIIVALSGISSTNAAQALLKLMGGL